MKRMPKNDGDANKRVVAVGSVNDSTELPGSTHFRASTAKMLGRSFRRA